MNERIHRALDGDLDADALTPAERRELVALQSLLSELASSIHRTSRPDFTERVMARVPYPAPEAESLPEPALKRAFRWFWAPKSFALVLRPAYAAAALVMIVFATYLTMRTVTTPPVEVATADSSPTVLYVQFRLEAPGASSVQLAGSFTNWDSAVTLDESAPGVWSTLIPLEPGVHDYAFVIDGRTWVVDPTAPAVDDGFGGTNSRLFLTHPGGNV